MKQVIVSQLSGGLTLQPKRHQVSGDKSHTPPEARHFGFLLSPPRLEKGLHHTQLLHLPGTPKAASPWEVTGAEAL